LPCGPVGPPFRWAATSNVEVGQTTYPANRRKVGREGREEREGQSHKEEEREGWSGTVKGVQRPLSREGGLYVSSTWVFV